MKSPKNALTLISIGLFFMCLPFASFYINGEHVAPPSWRILGVGFIAAITQWSAHYWFANPILVLSWLFIGAGLRRIALFSSTAALLLAASFLPNRTILIDIDYRPSPITEYGLGYWLWLASMLSAFLAACFAFWRGDSSKPIAPSDQ